MKVDYNLNILVLFNLILKKLFKKKGLYIFSNYIKKIGIISYLFIYYWTDYLYQIDGRQIFENWEPDICRILYWNAVLYNFILFLIYLFTVK